MPDEGPASDIDQRIEDVVEPDADLQPVAGILGRRRDDILSWWLEAARAQPFHHDKPDAAVTDDIPSLFDAIVDLLRRSRWDGVRAPMDDPGVVDAASAHARVRFGQGLGPVAVVTEFRLLRHEISRALVESVNDAPASDILAGQAIVDDALDGAAAIGLTALSERIEELREGFLATTLHDVRQPITLVTGSLDLAARWLADPAADRERVAEVVEGAVVAVTEINAMLDTLGDASRVAMGALVTDPEPARLDTIVEEALALLDREARARIRYQASTTERFIGLWDDDLLRRVVVNLVGNALKYTPDGSPIDVSIEGDADPGHVRLLVQDRGIGVSDDELETVFERFGRADRARVQGIPGLGLGLYACRGIVAAHGGTIDLRSDGPGLGTTVCVTLPLLLDDGDA